MIERSTVELILRANGVSPTASDEEIKELLLEARWCAADAEAALSVLRENKTAHEQKIDSAHEIFNTDQRLKPEAITQLLGIDVEVQRSALQSTKVRAKAPSHVWQIVKIVSVSLLLAFGISVFCMWYWEVGAFHYSVKF